ncbi:hypothetical protein GWI33_004289 [Rhynchophorus ferrugineus]|uniref:Uncharacterized protein n=1 Tax=Rhynchophorus ferrugineus TaxID=354439 RepID=A0A834MKJ2_RHYFE|nr:hypothetical protein GWI33_004289 [Rhynchophorus ferrugineus]
MIGSQKDDHIRHLEGHIAIVQNQVNELINMRMTTSEIDNELIDFGKYEIEASSESEGEFQSVRRKKEKHQKQQAKRLVVDQNRCELLR